MHNPCRDCQHRKSACHVYCRTYIEWKEEYDKQAADIYRQKKSEYDADYIQYEGRGTNGARRY